MPSSGARDDRCLPARLYRPFDLTAYESGWISVFGENPARFLFLLQQTDNLPGQYHGKQRVANSLKGNVAQGEQQYRQVTD